MLMKFLSTSRVRTLNIEDIGLGPLGFQELENAMSKEVEVVYINIRLLLDSFSVSKQSLRLILTLLSFIL